MKQPTSRRVAFIYSAVGALLLAWSGFVGVQNLAIENEFKEQNEAAAKVDNFYRIVAGDVQPQGFSVSNRLAVDLRTLIEAENSGDRIVRFKGDSNAYGGITLELGFDPFNGVNCSECGPLDVEVQKNLFLIDEGELDQVLASNDPQKGDTLPQTNKWIWILYLLGGIPSGILIYRFEQGPMRKLWRECPDEMSLIRQMDRAIEELPRGVGRSRELIHARTQLMDEIRYRVNAPGETVKSVELESLVERANSTLDAYREGNKALRKGME